MCPRSSAETSRAKKIPEDRPRPKTTTWPADEARQHAQERVPTQPKSRPTRRMSAKLGELISGIICTALSLVAAYLTLVLFYGTVLMVFHYAFGVALWNPFQGGGAGMGG